MRCGWIDILKDAAMPIIAGVAYTAGHVTASLIGIPKEVEVLIGLIVSVIAIITARVLFLEN